MATIIMVAQFEHRQRSTRKIVMDTVMFIESCDDDFDLAVIRHRLYQRLHDYYDEQKFEMLMTHDIQFEDMWTDCDIVRSWSATAAVV